MNEQFLIEQVLNLSLISIGTGFGLFITNLIPLHIYLVNILNLPKVLALFLGVISICIQYSLFRELIFNKLIPLSFELENTKVVLEINVPSIIFISVNLGMTLVLLWGFKKKFA